jgi:hypothetical protein
LQWTRGTTPRTRMALREAAERGEEQDVASSGAGGHGRTARLGGGQARSRLPDAIPVFGRAAARCSHPRLRLLRRHPGKSPAPHWVCRRRRKIEGKEEAMTAEFRFRSMASVRSEIGHWHLPRWYGRWYGAVSHETSDTKETAQLRSAQWPLIESRWGHRRFAATLVGHCHPVVGDQSSLLDPRSAIASRRAPTQRCSNQCSSSRETFTTSPLLLAWTKWPSPI